jgi:hypothetical protein
MDPIFKIYIAFWVTAMVIALSIFLKNIGDFIISQKSYWYFLLKPWKIITFIVAASGITIIAPYTGDPTWDYVDALFMSTLTFTTAPWATGILYQGLYKKADVKEIYVAICFWLFSASWSYDLYLLIRDGYYPITWWSNLCASSILYLLAGMFWNLDWSPKTGVKFSFMMRDWPHLSTHSVFGKIVWIGLLFMILVAALILSFL